MTKFAAVLLAAFLMGSGTTAPVAAQGLNFGIFFGDEPSDFYPDYGPREPGLPLCLTDRQIRQAIEEQGYADVALNVPNESHIQVRATRDGAVYLLDFNFCTGRIEGRERLR